MTSALMKCLVFVPALGAFAACGGGGGSSAAPSSDLIVISAISATTTPAVTTPIPIGSSATIMVTEQTCRYAKHGTNPPGQGCGAVYVLATVSAVVQPNDNTGTPCGMTLQFVKPGTFVATRTTPGDPVRGGACEIDFHDLAANGFGSIFI